MIDGDGENGSRGKGFVGVERHFLSAETSVFIPLDYIILHKWTTHTGQEKNKFVSVYNCDNLLLHSHPLNWLLKLLYMKIQTLLIRR